jgi:hypothetical protein
MVGIITHIEELSARLPAHMGRRELRPERSEGRE